MIRRSIATALLSISLIGASPPTPQPLVLAFGDSLTAGCGLDPGLGFAPQLQETLLRHGIAATVVDGGVSGDTSEAGKARLGWTLDGLERKPDLVILELGANDMLRGLDPELTSRNLDAMLGIIRHDCDGGFDVHAADEPGFVFVFTCGGGWDEAVAGSA